MLRAAPCRRSHEIVNAAEGLAIFRVQYAQSPRKRSVKHLYVFKLLASFRKSVEKHIRQAHAYGRDTFIAGLHLSGSLAEGKQLCCVFFSPVHILSMMLCRRSPFSARPAFFRKLFKFTHKSFYLRPRLLADTSYCFCSISPGMNISLHAFGLPAVLHGAHISVHAAFEFLDRLNFEGLSQ